MKKYIILLVIVCSSGLSYAQTWSEWFRQKKTGIEYLISQTAALKVYGDAAWKGYRITKDGLTAIGDIKDGDFTLLSNYFSSLRDVNPSVKNYWKVAEIIRLQVAFLNLYRQQKEAVQNSAGLTTTEKTYISKVLNNVLSGSVGLVDILIILTTPDSSGMKDDERLKRIDALFEEMQDKVSFLQHYENEIRLLLVQRLREQKDVKTTKSLYGVH